MAYYAVHQIQHYSDGQFVTIPPGNLVGGLDEAEAQRLLKLGALTTDRPSNVESVPAPVHNAPSVQEQVQEAKAARSREQLEARAEELEVKFNKNISDEKLAERLAEAEAELSK